MKENRWITSEDDLLVFDSNCVHLFLYLLLYFLFFFSIFSMIYSVFFLKVLEKLLFPSRLGACGAFVREIPPRTD